MNQSGAGWLIASSWLQSRFGVSFAGDVPFYFLCLGVLAAVLFLLLNLMRSATGRAFIGLRDSESESEEAVNILLDTPAADAQYDLGDQTAARVDILDVELCPGANPILVGRAASDLRPLDVPLPRRDGSGRSCWSSPGRSGR